MTAAENVYDSTRNFLTPESVKKFSLALDEPTHKVHAGLQSIVPTLLDGIISEGSTTEGAERMINCMDGEASKSLLSLNLTDENYLSRGENLVEDIFGDEYHSIASSLTPSTGLDTRNVEKLMEMAAPAVLGAIGSKIKDVNAENLNDYLKEQKNLSTGFEDKNKPPFSMVIAGLIVAIVGTLWFMSTRLLPVSTLKRQIATIEKEYTPVAVNKPKNGLTVQDLSTFLATATMEDLPKRFTVKHLEFIPGTTDMRTGGDKDIEMMVTSLKRYPKSMASVEAYIEDTGDADENLLLSENRAMLVREELIGRGIEPSRVKAEGRGPRQTGNQIYFVINGI